MLCNPRNANFYVMLAADALCMAAALTLSYLIRFDFSLPPIYATQLVAMFKYVLPIKLGAFFLLGLYRGMWRYFSAADFWKLFEASLLSTALVVALVAYRFGFTGFSRAVLAMDGVLTLLFAGGVRLSIRTLCSRGGFPGTRRIVPKKKNRRILIIGAGDLGERLVREISLTPELNYAVVGFLDDAPEKRGRALHGKAVLGPVSALARIAREKRVDEVCIAVSHAGAVQMRAIVGACTDAGIPHRILPDTGRVLDGRLALTLRPVDYADLLGRTEAALDEAGIAGLARGRVILVTGCGGSIGSELCRQLIRFAPERLVLVDACEYNLYAIARELSAERNFTRFAAILGSVGDAPLMDRVMASERPSLVLHAAAYKHVPMLEANPWAAVTNNILGTRTIMRAAVAAGVERFILVSTDKAVRPSSVMGASKRVTELLMAGFADSPTKFMAVRFGNVVGSSGSVVPLFRRQIARGGPVTVTHPRMTRYFMSISEACQLILQAAALGPQNGRNGEIFVLDMGEPVRIADMARDLIRLSGKEPGADVDIVFTGPRPGEKLAEELVAAGEGVTRTAHEKIMVLDGTLGAHPENTARKLEAKLAELVLAAEKRDAEAIRDILREIVPEYAPAARRPA